MLSFVTSFLLLTHVWSSVAVPVDTILNLKLDSELKDAPTALHRASVLSDSSEWVYDFWRQPYHTDSPGGVVNANAATFPAAVGNGLTMAWITLGPCAMLPPHYHPRASNIITAIEGKTQVHMILENGGELISTLLDPGKVTILPQGSTHTMQNTGCDNATLISALNSEDAGTHNLANALSMLPKPITLAAFGNAPSLDFDELTSRVPEVGTGANHGSAECSARCGLSSGSGGSSSGDSGSGD